MRTARLSSKRLVQVLLTAWVLGVMAGFPWFSDVAHGVVPEHGTPVVFPTPAAIFTPAPNILEPQTTQIIIDDQDPGFDLYGPSNGWHNSGSSDSTYNGHAYWTYTTDTWGNENNWATWTVSLPESGLWEVFAYIPYVVTGRYDTTRARYQIQSADGYNVVERDQNNNTGWVSLGAYNFNAGTNYFVRLEDVTPDWYFYDNGEQYRKTIKFDAIKWVRGGGTSPASVSIWVDRGEGAVYRVGDPLQLCYSVSRPIYIKIYDCQPGQACRVILEGQDDGRGDCRNYTVTAPTGWETVRIEAIENGQVVAQDETYFYVTDDVETEPPAGYCRVRWLAATSNDCSGEFGLYSPQRITLFSDYEYRPSPDVKQFGPFDPDTSLVFYIRPWSYCAPAEYLSTSANAHITELGTNHWQIAWEDLPPDRADDYDDLIVDVECGISVPTNTPTPTRAPTRTPTPTRVPTRTPTPTSTPQMGPNPPELRDKDELIRYLESPGFLVLGIQVPPEFMAWAPNWGYDERGVRAWIGRFRSSGYSPAELSALRRLKLSEEAMKSYYEQSLQVTDRGSEAVVKLVFALRATDIGLEHLQDAARTVPVVGTILGKTLEQARKVANTLLNNVLNLWIDAVIRDPIQNRTFKGAAAVMVDHWSHIGMTQLPKYSLEIGGRVILNGAIAKLYIGLTQNVLDNGEVRARQGQVFGSDVQAENRVQERIQRSEIVNKGIVDALDVALEAADFAGVVSDLSGLIALATAPIPNPVSAVSLAVSKVARTAQLALLGTSVGAPIGRGIAINHELVEAGSLAFDPWAQVGRSAAMTGGTPAVPLGAMPTFEPAVGLAQAQDTYDTLMNQLAAAVAENRFQDVLELTDDLFQADDGMVRALKIEQGPVQAALTQVAADESSYSSFNTAVNEVVTNSTRYHAERLRFQLVLASYIASGGSNSAQAGLLDRISSVLRARDEYLLAVQQSRQAGQDIAIPGYVILTETAVSPSKPQVGRRLTLTLTVRNTGGAIASGASVDVTVPEGLRVWSSTHFDISTLAFGSTQELTVELEPLRRGDSPVLVSMRQGNGGLVMESVLVSVEGVDAGGYNLHLPLILKNHPRRSGPVQSNMQR